MRAVLIDDEKPNLELLKIMIAHRKDIDIIGAYTNASVALEAIEADPPDLIFTDIEMPQMSGIELGRKIRRLPHEISLIFVTAYSEYAVDAFELNAVHYLLKPVSESGIDACMQRVLRARPELNYQSKAWSIRCFGQFEIYGERADEAVKWTTAKSAELFAYLLMNHGRTTGKWDICETLWGAMDPKRMEHNLHSTVNRVRQSLREVGIDNVLLRDTQGYRLDLSLFHCDYLEYISLVKSYGGTTQLDVAKRIVNLYVGPLFNNPDYEWVQHERSQIERIYIDCLQLLARHAMKTAPNHAESILNRLLELEPCNEKVVAALMNIHAKQLNKAALVHVYDKLRKHMHAELRTEPSQATEKLYQDLMATF